jgi:hypothetical protein
LHIYSLQEAHSKSPDAGSIAIEKSLAGIVTGTARSPLEKQWRDDEKKKKKRVRQKKKNNKIGDAEGL